MKAERMLMGNEAIGRGLVENGCSLAASYPGTPASEILSSVVAFAKELGVSMHTEWSVNEKTAVEVALAHSYTGKRAAVAMKQVGLNVAADPVTRAAYLGVKGGFVIIAADDPGPHSSQTEQDSRFFAHFAKIPVLDPSNPREAKEMVPLAFDLSEKYEIPVMIRPTTRICHSRQNVECSLPIGLVRRARFEKDPTRWSATPQFLYRLHEKLNGKIRDISGEEGLLPVRHGDGGTATCIISSGIAFAHTFELLEDMGLTGSADLFQVLMPYPLSRAFVDRIGENYRRVLVIEETYPVIEMQLTGLSVEGRRSGLIPSQGELTPEVIEESLRSFFGLTASDDVPQAQGQGKRPSLCPGCSHRAAFYAIRNTFPKGIFPSDIGCYTLGMNMGAVDTCHCMGACISQGAGFYHAYAEDGDDFPSIVVTIGDSTFFHAGIPALVNAVFQKARFILVILDNATTAMTGHQPTPQTGFTADGTPGNPVLIPDLVRACGVRFLREHDPYDVHGFISCLKEADAYTRGHAGGVAVIIAKRPCIMQEKVEAPLRMAVTDACNGCGTCIEFFECPALIYEGTAVKGKRKKGRVSIDRNTCTGCGICQYVCPKKAIIPENGGRI